MIFMMPLNGMLDVQEPSSNKVDGFEVTLNTDLEKEIKQFYPHVSLFDIKRSHLIEFLVKSRNLNRASAEKARFMNESRGERFEVLLPGLEQE